MKWRAKILHNLLWAWKDIKRRKMISIRCWILEECHPNQIRFIFLHMTWLKIGNIDDKSEIFLLHYSSFSGYSAKKLTEWGTGCIDDSEKFLIKILLRNHLPLFKAFVPWRNGKSLFPKAETDEAMTTSWKLLLHDEAPAMRILIDRRPYEF